MMLRHPAVAGQFYPANAKQLRQTLQDCWRHSLGPGDAEAAGIPEKKLVAAVVPHAGYVYSGMVAAHVYQLVLQQFPNVVLMLGPNHWGRGEPVALYPEGSWQTPLGAVEIDLPLAARLLREDLIQADYRAHLQEHSLEVQLPFLQQADRDFTFVPIALRDQSLSTAIALGEILAQAIQEDSRRILVLASSDFSHYVSPKVAQTNDALAIEQILALRPERFHDVVQNHDISICGPGPIIAAMTVAARLQVNQGRLLKYATSGDVQPMPQVVGYAAIAFES